MLRQFLIACWGIIGLAALSVAGPAAKVTLLSGGSQSGDLTALTADGVQISGAAAIPLKDVMELDLPDHAIADPGGALGLTLTDGSNLLVSSVELAGGNLTVKPVSSAALTFSSRQARAIRFLPLDDAITTNWNELVQRTSRDDLVVIRKGDVLDYVAGAIGKINEQSVVVLTRGQELAAPRERVFGLIFSSASNDAAKRGSTVKTVAGESLMATEIKLAGDNWQLTTTMGALTLPMNRVKSIDFGGGRIRLLASLPFDAAASKAPAATAPVWFVSVNSPAGTGGRAPLIIGRKEFSKGLWLHSGAELKFALNRGYTRLRTTAGFDLTHAVRMPRFDPQVKLVILGDGKEIHSSTYRWNDAPQALDLNLTDVRELVIRVESAGKAQGVLEHFALGDAQVIQ